MSDAVAGDGRNGGCGKRSSNFLGGCLTGCFAALVLLVGVPVVLTTLAFCKIGALVETETKTEAGKKVQSYDYTWRWGDGDASSVKVVRLYLQGVIMGDGEEETLQTIDMYKKWKASGLPREAYLRMCAEIPGIYVPSLYDALPCIKFPR